MSAPSQMAAGRGLPCCVRVFGEMCRIMGVVAAVTANNHPIAVPNGTVIGAGSNDLSVCQADSRSHDWAAAFSADPSGWSYSPPGGRAGQELPDRGQVLPHGPGRGPER